MFSILLPFGVSIEYRLASRIYERRPWRVSVRERRFQTVFSVMFTIRMQVSVECARV